MNLLVSLLGGKCMKNKKLFIIFTTLLLILGFLGLNSKNQNVKASYLNGNSYASMATRHVVVTRRMPVYKCRTGKCEAANRFHRNGSVRKGTKLYISRWLMSTGSCWVIKSRRYYHNRRTFFVVPGRKANWYRRIR